MSPAHNPTPPSEPSLWQRTKAIAGEALELSPLAREAFVESSCANDPALLSEVRALLDATREQRGTLSDDGLPASVLADAIDTPALAPGTMIGRYRVEHPIGTGGMGAVFEATDTSLKRTVAIKVLAIGLASTGARRRFEGETTALARLEHPAIARIYEAGVHTSAGVSVPFFAMAFVEGARTLDTFLRETKPDVRTILALFARVCDAVHHGHQKSVLHRDLKPSNILIDRDGNPKVIDFGVSRLQDVAGATHSTRAGDIVGTPAYLPPEAFQHGMQALDTRADVYSLGVVLYEALAGTNPFGTPTLTPIQIGQLVCSKPAPLLAVARPECRGDIETIVAKAMAREPEDRYQSAEQLAADVRRVLAYEPILARPAPLLRQARLFARRNRLLVASTAAVSLAVILGVVGLTTGLARARESERRARDEARRATQVSTFVMQMLRAASPFQDSVSRARLAMPGGVFEDASHWPTAATPGMAPTVGDLLFAATTQLDTSFPDDPSLRADMAAALADTASSISDRRVPAILERSESLLAKAYGKNDPRTLAARQYVYSSKILNGDTTCLPDIERDLFTIRALPQPMHGDLLNWAWSHYQSCLRTQGRERDALPTLLHIRAEVERSYRADSKHKVSLDLAILRATYAGTNARDALNAMPTILNRARLLPPADQDTATLSVMFDVQEWQRAAGDNDAAIHTLAQGIVLSTRIYGGMDQATYEWWNNLYFLALQMGHLDIAEYAAREQVRGARAMLGPHSFYTTKAYGRLARTLLTQDKNLDEAEAAARAAVSGTPEELAKGDGWALYHELLWAWSIRLRGDPRRALQIMQDRTAAEVRAGRPGSVNWVELLRSTELAQCEMDLGTQQHDLPSRLPRVHALLLTAEACCVELGPDWPSVRLTAEARERYDSLKKAASERASP